MSFLFLTCPRSDCPPPATLDLTPPGSTRTSHSPMNVCLELFVARDRYMQVQYQQRASCSRKLNDSVLFRDRCMIRTERFCRSSVESARCPYYDSITIASRSRMTKSTSDGLSPAAQRPHWGDRHHECPDAC